MTQSALADEGISSDFGVSLAQYRYDEPGVMSIQSTKFGFSYWATAPISTDQDSTNGWHLRGGLHYATGAGNYSSDFGRLSDRPDWYYEGKLLLGKSIQINDIDFAPYFGLAYRYHWSDLRGVITDGVRYQYGYRRETSYLTLPIGVVHRSQIGESLPLSTTVEYSHLLAGKHTARLSDTGLPGRSDVSLSQRKGFGVMLSAQVKLDEISIGPTVSYWKIQASEVGGTAPNQVVEPKNKTIEVGVGTVFHF